MLVFLVFLDLYLKETDIFCAKFTFFFVYDIIFTDIIREVIYMAEKTVFQSKCEEKIKEIDQRSKSNKKLPSEIFKNISNLIKKDGAIDEYIKSVSEYAKNMKNGEEYKNDVLKFINSSHIDYKKLRCDTGKVFDGLIDEIQRTEKSSKPIVAIKDCFEKAVKWYESTVKTIKKKLSSEKGLARVETLEHNLLYCKNNDITKSNKIGFLDYLYYVASDNEYNKTKNKQLTDKLREPFNFTDIFSSSFSPNISRSVSNYCEKLEKNSSNSDDANLVDLNHKKFYEEAKEIEKDLYDDFTKSEKIQLTKRQIKNILKSSVESTIAANAYGDLNSDYREDILSIIRARAMTKVIVEYVYKIIHGNPEKLMTDGIYEALVNAVNLFSYIAFPIGSTLFNMGKDALKLVRGLSKLGKGVYLKIKNKKKSKN